MAISGFGNARVGARQFNNWRIKEGDQEFRFMPPMFSLMNDIYGWAVYKGTHFGFYGRDPQAPKDPSKKRMRTFLCIEKKGRNGVIEQDCPRCTQEAAYEAEAKAHEAELQAKKLPEDQIKTEMAPYNAWMKANNRDRKHHLNAMNPRGEFGVLQISHKTKLQLDDRMKKLQKDDINPFDPEQGAWFNINRVGGKLQVVDTVDTVYEDIDIGGGRKAKIPKSGKMTEDQIKAALEQCRDLAEIGTVLSYEQIEMLVKCSGDLDEVDAIFALSEKADKKEKHEETRQVVSAETKAETKASAVTEKPAVKEQPASAPIDGVVQKKAPDLANPAIAARLAKIKAQEAEKAQIAQKAKEEELAARIKQELAAKTAATETAELDAGEGLSDEEFLAQFASGQAA